LKTFKDAVRTRDFALTAEIYLRPESDADAIRRQADVVREHVDAILVTDNQFGQLHLSPLVAAGTLLNHGVDAVVQMTSRNRNRIALLSDLLGAGVLGVTSLLLVRGERPPSGMVPKPKAVFDVNAVEFIRIASTVKADPRLQYCPDFLVGSVMTPQLPRPNWKAKRLEEKIDAGAQFVQTHICMNMKVMDGLMKRLVDDGVVRRASFIGAVAVLESGDDARWLQDNRPNVMIPDRLIARLDAAADPREEGIRIAVETLQAMAQIPGIAGANIMASRDLSTIPQVIDRAGLVPRDTGNG
jgi:methylenetetrahydrofolate reductase (NADPH)